MTAQAASILPRQFREWFAGRGWAPRDHQLALLEKYQLGRSALLIAPTGAGKTLAGFLPSLAELAAARTGRRVMRGSAGIHTLYISPLKALAVDIARNLSAPVEEMALPVAIETRTGDTPASRRARQRRNPPDILLTTPEQLALLIASGDAMGIFGGLKRVIIDELHAFVPTKRGDLMALGLQRLFQIAPGLTVTGLSATVRDPDELRRWIVPQPGRAAAAMADLVVAAPSSAARPLMRILEAGKGVPWASHSAAYAVPDIYAAIKAHRLSLVFVNTRSQAELLFNLLWSVNDDTLRIALHHGSLDAGQRRKVEAAMAAGKLQAVVCTSTLDLGIDWGDVDLVINVGAPKGASRLLQRIGRANHRLDEASQALLVPSNRFEVLECRAAVDAAYAGEHDAALARRGGLDVLAQHILGMAVARAFSADALYNEVRAAEPYTWLTRSEFDDVTAFVATGGYALKTYERFARIRLTRDQLWRVSNPRVAQGYRMNVGTIVEETMLKVRLGRARSAGAGATGPIGRFGRVLGEVEEYFAEQLSPGDTFAFAGEVLRFEAISEDSVITSRARSADPKVPAYAGGKFPLSTHLAARVRAMLADKQRWNTLPKPVADWLRLQAEKSALPGPGTMLIETFPRGGRYYMAAYPFEGRLAHQTLGMLLTRRLERAGLKPLGFVASDYALAVWGLDDIGQAARERAGFLAALFDMDMLGDDLEEWLAESALMKRAFRNCALISGLIERRYPGHEKRMKQMTISTDLIYDVLRQHQPDHVLLRAARADAASGLLDIERLGLMLQRIKGQILHKNLARPSPLSVPILLEIGREPVYGEAGDALLAEAADALVREIMA